MWAGEEGSSFVVCAGEEGSGFVVWAGEEGSGFVVWAGEEGSRVGWGGGLCLILHSTDQVQCRGGG